MYMVGQELLRRGHKVRGATYAGDCHNACVRARPGGCAVPAGGHEGVLRVVWRACAAGHAAELFRAHARTALDPRA